MKISVKGRYAIASMVIIGKARDSMENTTIISISERLGLSKIYMEQVFALLKRAELVLSVKGAQGGYRLAKKPEIITVYDILAGVENALFDKTENTVSEKANDIETVMQSMVFSPLDVAVKTTLTSITLEELINESEKYTDSMMFYI